MKNEFLKFSSKRILFSAAMASALCVGSPQQAFANVNEVQAIMQAGTVKGTVVDATGEPIIGANIMVKGTTNGCITDIDGNFSLSNAKGTLVVSFIGYKSQEIVVKGNETNLKVVLAEDSEMLDEVVVVGYGTQKKATMTGSVTVVNQKMLENKGTMSSPVQALQGQVPGVIITRNSTAPGDESWNMSLRGAVSKNTTSPLVIIDGVEYESVNELRLLNPSDIESINFLKDASASIYGSKAAGGVVLVTTKKAQAGKVQVDYSGSVTSKFIGLSPHLMSLEQWASSVIDARTNDGYGDDDTWMRYAKLALAYKNQYINLDHTTNPFGNAFTDVADFVFFDTNWQDIMWGTAASTQHELAIAGGSDASKYRLSLGYMYDDSNLKWGNNNNNRYNLRLTNTFKLSNRASIESVIAYNRQDQVAPTQIGSALTTNSQQPGFPSATANGKPYAWGTWGAPNWYCELGGDNKLKVSAINISETFRYSILKDLTASVTAGYNTSTAIRDKQSKAIDWYNYAGDRVVRSNPTEDKSSYSKSNSRTDFYSLSGHIDWSHIFADVHDVKVMVGSQYNLKEYEGTFLYTEGILPSLEIPNSTKDVVYLKNGDDKSTKWQEAVMSYFGRINYNYRSKYMLEAQGRYDGSSKFQPENRWVFYWGTSAGWRISEEAFMKNLSFVDELKLRASYGSVGNQSGVDRYDGAQLYNFTPSGGALIGNGKISYVDTNGKLPSTDRTWERIHNYNIGLDFGFLDGRISGSIDVYKSKTNDMLLNRSLPYMTGFSEAKFNAGEVMNRGVELSLNTVNINGDGKDNFRWESGLTFYRNKNKIVHLFGKDANGKEANDTGNATTNGYETARALVIGESINAAWDLKMLGIFQSQAEIDSYVDANGNKIQPDAVPGDIKFLDYNGDGKISTDDRHCIGDMDPLFTINFSNTLSWKNFSLYFNFRWDAGNSSHFIGSDPFGNYHNTATTSGAQLKVAPWSENNPTNEHPRLGYVNTYSYYFWSQRQYLKLKDLSLSYTFDQPWVKKANIQNLRLYLSGTDLFTITGWSGLDPETGGTIAAGPGSSRYGSKPAYRTLTIGANITF